MKNTRISSAGLIMLILVVSCSISLSAFGGGTDNDPIADSPDLYLELPRFEKLVIGDGEWFAADAEGFRGVLGIYATYQTLGDLHLELTAEVELLDDEVALLEESVGECQVALSASEDDRTFVYRLRESDQKKAAAAAKRQKVRAILFGAGGGVVALAAGLLIGMFAF